MASRLQAELKKKRPFAALDEEAALNIARTGDRLQLHVERLIREFGLDSGSQYNVLRILRGAAERLPVLEIASRTVTVVPGITGLIDRVEAKGLVTRERCKQDRRKVYVSITEKGLALLAELDGPLEELNRRLFGHLSESEKAELIRLLEKVREALPEE
ncbi:MAG: MarR family winged helix-turn-helix transcriptional regulator [Gemmataceae bacterium]